MTKEYIERMEFRQILKQRQIIRNSPDRRDEIGGIIAILDNMPAAAVAHVVHGEWEPYSTTMMECSVCKRHTARHRFEFCPHCGAKMDGGKK